MCGVFCLVLFVVVTRFGFGFRCSGDLRRYWVVRFFGRVFLLVDFVFFWKVL